MKNTIDHLFAKIFVSFPKSSFQKFDGDVLLNDFLVCNYIILNDGSIAKYNATKSVPHDSCTWREF